MDFCNKLQSLRKQADLTQDELALKIGVSRQAISKWESGNAYPDLNNIQTICSFFSVSADTLLNPKYEAPIASEARFSFNESELGNNIKRIRTMRGITQEALAEQMKVSRQSVSNWENSSVIPKTEIIILMLDFLQTEFSDLLPHIAEADTEENKEASMVNESAQVLPQKAKRSKRWVLFLLIPVFLIVLGVSVAGAVLFKPFIAGDPFLKSFREIIFDTEALDAFSENAKNNGVEITLGSGIDAFTVKVHTSDAGIAVTGLNGDETLLLPRENALKALEDSIFNPDRKTQFSLSAEDYNKLFYAIRLYSADKDELEKNIQRIMQEIERISQPKESFSFAEGRFALEKNVSWKLDKQAIILVLEAVSAEMQNGSAFNAMCRITGAYDIFLSVQKDMKKNIKSADISFSYSESDGRISDMSYSCEISFNDNTVSNSSFYVKFIYGAVPGFEVTQQSSENISGIYISEVSRYIYTRETFSNGLKVSVAGEISGEMEIGGKTQRYKTSSNHMLEYNSETREFSAIYNDSEDEITAYGIWELDPEAGKLAFAVNYMGINGRKVVGTETLALSMQTLGETEFPDGKSFFSLSEREMKQLSQTLPTDKFETFKRIIKRLTEL